MKITIELDTTNQNHRKVIKALNNPDLDIPELYTINEAMQLKRLYTTDEALMISSIGHERGYERGYAFAKNPVAVSGSVVRSANEAEEQLQGYLMIGRERARNREE